VNGTHADDFSFRLRSCVLRLRVEAPDGGARAQELTGEVDVEHALVRFV
jgi:hypothetical protein